MSKNPGIELGMKGLVWDIKGRMLYSSCVGIMAGEATIMGWAAIVGIPLDHKCFSCGEQGHFKGSVSPTDGFLGATTDLGRFSKPGYGGFLCDLGKKADFGYHKVSRNVKKIGNLYKYHKRTKGCRASEVDGKNYRIYNQLEALENIASEQRLGVVHLASYYRRFVMNFTSIDMHLTRLTQKEVPFMWSDKYEESFQRQMTLLTPTSILTLPKEGRQDQRYVVKWRLMGGFQVYDFMKAAIDDIMTLYQDIYEGTIPAKAAMATPL
ncbi:hypothetical protein MTR67_017865 [Solanum verrucosum]|uniref:Uncharacterized protein n=1 Tax=Solanum verrucosum TaxID=315347 RepID=A0AAF0QNR0_SOLVR|nr:hypothetical protein MTR67_017865 [Solanum verrucosum]